MAPENCVIKKQTICLFISTHYYGDETKWHVIGKNVACIRGIRNEYRIAVRKHE
jgi:hypothetical protein